MLRLAADENFNGDIVRGLLRRNPKLDIVRVQDVGLSGADDPSVLQWAADQGRILVTHDISTLVKHAFSWPNAASRANGRDRCASCPSELVWMEVNHFCDGLYDSTECFHSGRMNCSA